MWWHVATRKLAASIFILERHNDLANTRRPVVDMPEVSESGGDLASARGVNRLGEGEW